MRVCAHISIYLYIYIYIEIIACVAQWLRRQTHKQYDMGSSLVRTINSFYKIGLKILFRSDLL